MLVNWDTSIPTKQYVDDRVYVNHKRILEAKLNGSHRWSAADSAKGGRRASAFAAAAARGATRRPASSAGRYAGDEVVASRVHDSAAALC